MWTIEESFVVLVERQMCNAFLVLRETYIADEHGPKALLMNTI